MLTAAQTTAAYERVEFHIRDFRRSTCNTHVVSYWFAKEMSHQGGRNVYVVMLGSGAISRVVSVHIRCHKLTAHGGGCHKKLTFPAVMSKCIYYSTAVSWTISVMTYMT